MGVVEVDSDLVDTVTQGNIHDVDPRAVSPQGPASPLASLGTDEAQQAQRQQPGQGQGQGLRRRRRRRRHLKALQTALPEQRLRQQIDIGLAHPEGQRRLPNLLIAPGQGSG